MEVQETEQSQEPIEEAPKTQEALMLEYLSTQLQEGMIQDFNKFFDFAKKCCESEDTKIETHRILQELEKYTDETTLLYLAKFRISHQKNPSLFIKLFDKAISENKTYTFIEKVLETNLYKELIKWIDQESEFEINKYQAKFVGYTNTTIYLPIKISNMLSAITRETVPEETEQKSSNMKFEVQLSLSEKQKWISFNIKLLQAIVEKTDSKDIKTLLIDNCISLGYSNLCDTFIIKKEDLIRYIKESFESPTQYRSVALHLFEKNKNTPIKLALESLKICSDKFNDIQSMYDVYELIRKDGFSENIQELEYWSRKIIEIDPTQDKARLNLAMILFSKKHTTTILTHNNEIVDLLKNNPLEEAKKLYCILYSDCDLQDMIELNPEELTSIIEKSITHKPEDVSIETQNKYIFGLIKSFLTLSDIEIAKAGEEASKAVKKYNDAKSTLTEDEKKELKQIIYSHPIFNKKNGWPERYTRVYNAIKTAYPDTTIQEYLKNIKNPCYQNNAICINDMRRYSLELKEGQTEHDKNFDGGTVLHHAAIQHQYDLIIFLIQNHPELINIKSRNGDTAVTDAIISDLNDEESAIEIIKALKEASPKITDESDGDGTAPIHLAAKFGLCKIFKYLIEECNSDFKLKNQLGYDSMATAIEYNQPNIIDYLFREKCVELQEDLQSINVIIYASTINNRPEIIKSLLNNLSQETKIKLSDILFERISNAIEEGVADSVKALISKDSIDTENDLIKIIAAEQSRRTGKEFSSKILIESFIKAAKDYKKIAPENKIKNIREMIRHLKEYCEILEKPLAAVSDTKKRSLK